MTQPFRSYEHLTIEAADVALAKINDIRNSIVGYQRVNWSAHIYPLVAALEEAGIHGQGYDIANAEAKTQVARIEELEEALRRIKAHAGKRMEEPDGVIIAEITYIAGTALMGNKT